MGCCKAFFDCLKSTLVEVINRYSTIIKKSPFHALEAKHFSVKIEILVHNGVGKYYPIHATDHGNRDTTTLIRWRLYDSLDAD